MECPLARRELRRCSGRRLALLATHPVANDLRELERVSAAELLLRLLDALRPDLVAHDRVLAQRLLDALEIGLRRGRAELLLCTRERKRHGEVVAQLDDDDLLLDPEDDLLLPLCDTANAVRRVRDDRADLEVHGASLSRPIAVRARPQAGFVASARDRRRARARRRAMSSGRHPAAR